jgi:hypothetical protein
MAVAPVVSSGWAGKGLLLLRVVVIIILIHDRIGALTGTIT